MKPAYRMITALTMLLGSSMGLAQSAATIPASLEGTYQVTFNRQVSYGVLPDGTQLTMVIAPGGSLCLADYVVANPVTRAGSPGEAVWSAPHLGLDLVLSDLTNGFNEVNVFQLDSTNLLAQITGDKISNSIVCEQLGAVPPAMREVSDIFQQAQQLFPDYFPPGSRANFAYRVIDGFITRNYQGAGMTLAIKNNQVFLQGKEYGSTLAPVGSINAIKQILDVERAHQESIANPGTPEEPTTPEEPATPEEPGTGIPPGDFSLTISGTVSASVFGVVTSTPLNISIDSIPAPESTDIDGLEDQVRDALANADGIDASTFTSFQITEVSVTNDRVFFRAQFAGTTTTSGLTVSQFYNLTYEYLRK